MPVENDELGALTGSSGLLADSEKDDRSWKLPTPPMPDLIYERDIVDSWEMRLKELCGDLSIDFERHLQSGRPDKQHGAYISSLACVILIHTCLVVSETARTNQSCSRRHHRYQCTTNKKLELLRELVIHDDTLYETTG